MKLRNKKTGEIADLDDWTLTGANDRITVESDHDTTKIFDYNSLAELNEEWEDYEPKEPLIKDEKIRALVRDWLMINKVDGAFRHNSNALRDGFGSLLVVRGGYFENLKSEAFYTTEELCGEEEE